MASHAVRVERDTRSHLPFTAVCQEPDCGYRSRPSYSKPVARTHAQAHRADTRDTR